MGDDRVQLKEAFTKKAKETTSQPTDVIFLYDSSGSVSDADFQMALQAGLALIGSFGRDASIGVCQFSSNCVIECSMTQDRSLLSKAHHGLEKNKKQQRMRKQSGGTSTDEALQTAKAMLSTGRSFAKKIVYLFTDGHPRDQKKAIAAGASLHQMGATIIGVGIGSVDKASLEQVCVGGSCFVIDSFETLMRVIPSAGNVTNVVPDSEIILTYHQTKKPIKLKEPLPIEITVKNIGRVPVHPDSILQIEGGEFYEKVVKILRKKVDPETKEVFTVSLEPTGRADVKNLPDIISVKIFHPNNGLLYDAKSEGFATVLVNMIDDVVAWKSPAPGIQKANIMVFGTAGAGKSTLVNKVFSLWHESFASNAQTFESDDHVTTQSEFYEEHQGFAFLDTVGLSDKNYKTTHFKAIVNGSLPLGFRINDHKEVDMEVLQTGSAQEREIHSAVFVIPQGFRFYETAKPEMIARFREFVLEAVRSDLNPIVVVTRLDEVQDEEERKGLRTKLSKITGVSEKDVFLVDNSDKDDEKDLEKEKTLYQILRRALDYAESNMKKKAKKNPNLQQTPSKSPSASAASPSSSGFPWPSSPKTPTNSSSSTFNGKGRGSPSTMVQSATDLLDSLTIHDIDSGRDELDIFGEFSTDQLLSTLRAEVAGELKTSSFEFVNPKTGNPILARQEDKAKLKNVMREEGGVVKVCIRKPPPHYF